MSVTSPRRGRATARAPVLIESVDRLVAAAAARDLVVVARELLLLDPEFERAFPRERNRPTAPGIAGAIRRVLDRDAFSAILPGPLRRELLALVAPASSSSNRPSRARILAVADESLRCAETIAPSAAALHLVRAQRDWVNDASPQKVRRGLEKACSNATSPHLAATALLHCAILSADHGSLDDALALLHDAARLDPGSLSVAWTLAVYALATGRQDDAERQLSSIVANATVPTLRRRALALHGHLDALARIGVLSAERARARADRFLSRLPPLPAARC